MELKNDFTVNAPIDKAWEPTDVERIAPCLPGASSRRSRATSTGAS